jgi:hypothetical protein
MGRGRFSAGAGVNVEEWPAEAQLYRELSRIPITVNDIRSGFRNCRSPVSHYHIAYRVGAGPPPTSTSKGGRRGGSRAIR